MIHSLIPHLLEVRAKFKRRESLGNIGVFVNFLIEDVEIRREIGGVEAEGGVVQLHRPLGDPLRRDLTAEKRTKYKRRQ